MNNKYEVLLLLDPSLDKDALAKTITDVEAKMGGNIVKKEEWGLKDLAYEIKKSKKAYYVLYYVETPFENIASLKEMIAIDKRVVRPMILRHEKKWPFEYKNASELKFPERKPRKEFTPRTFNKTEGAEAKAPEAKKDSVKTEES